MLKRSVATFALALGTLAHPIEAQVKGIPLVNNGAPTGISVGADVGFPNDAAGNYTAIGVNAAVGIGLLGVRGSLSHVSMNDADDIWAKGVTGTFRIFGGPLIPIRAMILAGWGQWKEGETSVTQMPLSLGIAATIPNPLVAIKPWIAPRIQLDRTSVKNGETNNDTHFGISGGVDLSLLSGLSFRAAYDRLSLKGSKPGVLSFGVGFSL